MSSLNKVYKDKQVDIKVNKTFMVPVSALYIEKGFNLREIDQEHVLSIQEGYANGELIPPIIVEVQDDDSIKIIDGHHRYMAAKLAGIPRIECKNFTGDAADQVVMMIKSSQGRNLTPVERARGYERLVNQGFTPEEISNKVGRSRGDVDNHLMLLTAPKSAIKAVQSGAVGYSTVLQEMRKGTDVGKKVEKAQKVQKATGAKKAKIATFTKKDHNSVMEILCGMDQASFPDELKALIAKYTEA